MPTYRLSILTPDGKVYENDITGLVAPGINGSFGVLAHHAPMLAATGPGVFKISSPDTSYFAVGGGMLEVSDGVVNFLADKAEAAADEADARAKVNLQFSGQ